MPPTVFMTCLGQQARQLNIQPGPDGVGIDGLEDGEMLPAELLLPLELGLVHVLDKEAVSEIR